MGAEYKEAVYVGDKSGLVSWFNSSCEVDRYEYGHGGYTGTFAEKNDVIIHDKIFDGRDEATEWIEENNDKWGPADAVKFKDGDDVFWLVGGWCSS